jgi:hypothetical protein
LIVRSPEETISRLEREKAELIAILRETRAQMNAIRRIQRDDVLLAPVRLSGLYRVGNHQPQNVYRGDQYIGVMFSAEDAASAVRMLNLHECPACPPSCGSCSHDPDCECYEHQDLHPGLGALPERPLVNTGSRTTGQGGDARCARTWLVSALNRPVRTEEVDELAASADGGLSVYVQKVGLPAYLGVWIDPEHGNAWHLYSDHPDDQHERFGWKRLEAAEGGEQRA